MFRNEVKYEGLVSRCFNYYHANVKIEHLYNSGEGSKLSLDYDNTMRKFFYDMKYIEDFIEEFEDEIPAFIIDRMKLNKEKLIIQLQEKWVGIGETSVFKNSLGVAELYREPLSKYIDNTSIFDFSKKYYLKGNMSFSNIGKEPDLSNQPSERKYFKALYETHKKNNMLKSLEEGVDIREDGLRIGEPQLKGIYFVNKEKDSTAPKIYKLNIETTLFQMKYLEASSYILRNVYFDFGDKILIRNNNDYISKFDVIFANPSDKYLQKGEYFIPYLGENNLIEIKEQK